MLFIGKYPVKSWRVKSRSQRNPDTGELLDYVVELWADKRFTCQCFGYTYSRKKKPCFHVRQIEKKILKEFGDLETAINFYRKNQPIHTHY